MQKFKTFLDNKISQYLVLFVLSLTMVIAAFPTLWGHCLGISLFCFVPLIIVIKQVKQMWAKAAVLWVFFQLFFAVLFIYSPPLLPPGIHHHNQFLAIWLLLLGAPPIYSGLMGLSIWLSENSFLGSLLASSTMVLGELILFNKLCQFPLTFAITVCDQPLFLQLAAWGGWAAISFVLWFINFYLVSVWFAQKKGGKLIVLGIVIAGILSGGLWRIEHVYTHWSHRTVSVVAVQPNCSWLEQSFAGFSPLYLGDSLVGLEDITQRAAALNPKIIVFSEGVTCRSLGEQKVYDRLKALSAKLPFPMLLECKMVTPQNTSASAAVWIQNGAIVRYRYKLKTVPFIESEPTGNLSQNVFFSVYRDVNIGALICFESLYPEIAQKLANEGANLLVCHANTSYFGKSNWPFLHGAYTPLRAAESGRTVLLVNQTGFSIGSDALGRLFLTTALDRRAVYSVKTPYDSIDTFYLKHPKIIWIFLIAILGFGMAIKIVIGRKKR